MTFLLGIPEGKNWAHTLQRPRRLIIYCLQTGDSEKPVVELQSVQSLRTGSPWPKVQHEGKRRPTFRPGCRGDPSPPSSNTWLVSFRPTLGGTRPTHSGMGGHSALLGPLTYMLISSKHLPNTPRNNVEPNLWTPDDQVIVTRPISHHTSLVTKSPFQRD